MKNQHQSGGIPISPLLSGISTDSPGSNTNFSKSRLLRISALSILVAAAISLIAKFLITLINIVTNLSFFGKLAVAYHSPAGNHLGLWVIIVPAVGGVLVGLMALYGSKAIRGHGIPEAMEQILTNQSRIKPSITLLKPISSAIAIGTGGPFGAEGPIIATGGALGSTLGQLFKITSNERKIILAAGATAGMSAIFGTPIAAVFLAIELLLFEFSPRSILPVALACITGAAGHHLLFEAGPVFPMPNLDTPTNSALAIYSGIGLFIGFLSIGVTKIVYFIEDAFEKLPIHWMWWPALGGLAVGLIGYFAPHTLGVGYDNIISVLSGSVAIILLLRLFFFKFLSWAIALGSGTSGGTLAPLLTIGGASGALIGAIILYVFPNVGISVPMAALIGMSAMFAGASRAYLTSITFALESTGQFHALLPLLGACTASYLVSFFLMENTIMTEKIARRGVSTPDSFEPDVLGKLTVAEISNANDLIFNIGLEIREVRDIIKSENNDTQYFIAADDQGNYSGIVSAADINKHDMDGTAPLKSILQSSNQSVKSNDNLRKAVELMAERNVEVLPVVAQNKVTGVISCKDIINAYKFYHEENDRVNTHISLKRQRLKVVVRGRELFKPKA
ncbi:MULTISPECIES: chloride channel protein [unclassified Mucilaginibacter]|uniref:chloride channel protein n=1 Tax=unclassified Mucilaginibacter TaxID=2617802 RepID=UPI002AC8B0B1|nr:MULTISPECIES: chloride channel protein [unclassified Mucilaginibacter]MEB0261158.1 chloride channel protein [Mucilaginibacter sp. 10I4]MEB0279628.1 chloride channel protein [Mucilaginibacter sp. 10B2]MEB0300310.1 chloride channel protein [Mucilaginibacter sp. 5C4]WPX22505.1 chloride channel protein [Mucilaginibacter sp. 5C4]